MKKRILLFTIIAGFVTLGISSWIPGAATFGWECTGAETGGNPTGCAAPSNSCHNTSASANIVLNVELDSAGVPTTHYKPGLSYMIKITGTNNTTTTLPKFGFQVGVIKGTTASAAPVNAGSFVTGSLPPNTNYAPASGSGGSYLVNVVEQSTQLAPSSGSGTTGTIYTESIPWTAPPAGTGDVSIWCVLNAVNDNGRQDTGDLWNTNHSVINEMNTTAVANLTSNIGVTTFPNPVINNLQLHIDEAGEGVYSVQVFSLEGKCVSQEQIEVQGTSVIKTINTANWPSGLYTVLVSKDGCYKVIPVVKQ